MNEFCERYAKLSRDQRLKVRKDMEAKVIENFPKYLKLNSTTAQLRAAARKKVDQVITLARKVSA